MAERWLADLADVVADAERDGVPVFVGEYDVMEELTGFHLHRGALASMQRPVLPTVASVVAGARRVLVLEDIVDHTNVGAAFRSGAALGIDAILVTPEMRGPVVPAGDPRLDGHRLPGAVDARSSRGRAGSRSCATSGSWSRRSPSRRTRSTLDALAAEPPERLALVLGTEGDGLTRRTIGAADLTVRIPMAGEVDSLNVAAAAAVAMWALRV